MTCGGRGLGGSGMRGRGSAGSVLHLGVCIRLGLGVRPRGNTVASASGGNTCADGAASTGALVVPLGSSVPHRSFDDGPAPISPAHYERRR
jgi:hypothetical protein